MKTVKRLLESIRRVRPRYTAYPLIITVILAACAQPCMAANRVFNVPTATGIATTDTANIQDTLDDAALAFNTSDKENHSGVTVIFPLGTYKISSRLTLTTTNCPSEGGGIMIRGQGRAGTIIQSSGSAGALAILNNVDRVKKIEIQIEDIQFQAAIPSAGPAIEVSPYMLNREPLEEKNLSITPSLRNVRIARTSLSNYYSYGFKGNNLKLPRMDDVIINGDTNGTIAGIKFSQTYGHKIKDCEINGAIVGIDHYIGGEANFFKRLIITNVCTGIRVENVVGHDYMSTSGGTVLHCKISASECGVSLSRKQYFFISDNEFNMLPGGAVYMDVKLTGCSSCFVTGNRFQGNSSASRTGVSLVKGSLFSEDIIISDNTFGSSAGTGVSVGSGIVRAKVFNNQFGMTTQLADNGSNTHFAAGTPNPFVSPAAGKDTESFSWGNNMGREFNVTNAPYYATGDGITDDTPAIKRAAADLTTYLNNGATRKGVLYFPAGTYVVQDQIVMSPTQGADLTICGDGMKVSVIARKSGGINGLFKLDFTSNHIRADIHDLMIIANDANAGDAIYIKQPTVPGALRARNLYMHNVIMDRKKSNYYFSNAVYGVNIARPFFENVYISMYQPAPDEARLPGTAGVLLTDVWGFECDDLGIGIGLETGLDIKSRGGDVLIKNGSPGGTAVGMKIDAGGGAVALESSHINAKFNLDVMNAAGMSFVSGETLSNRNSIPESGQAAVRLANCTNVHIQNIVFSKSWPLFHNPARRSIWLSGTANANVDIYGNLFEEPGATYVYAQSGEPSVRYNSFARTDVDDIQGAASGITRLCHLNGRIGQGYLLKNKISGKYLRVASGTALACDSTDVNDASQWKIVYDRASDRYTLESKSASPSRLMRDGTNLRCEGSDTSEARRWLIVNRGDGYYTLGGTAGSFVRSDNGNVSEIGVNPIDDNELWQLILAEDLVMGMDRGTRNVAQASGTVWTHVNFIKPFLQVPAVFAGGPSYADSDPLTVRVKNITASGFDVQLDEWDYLTGGKHLAEEVSFIALNKGSYKVENSGTRSVEAGTIPGVGTSWVTKTFNVPFTTIPCVFAQCTSTNEASAVCTRIRNVTTTGFQVMLQEQLSQGGGAHANESVDFIAIDSGVYQYFEVGRASSFADSNWTTLTFAPDDWNTPGFLSSVQSYSWAHPCALRYQNLSKTGVEVKVDEDGSNGETSHGFEDVGWMVFGNLE